MTTRSALFVDFDNVYLGLRGMDAIAAEVFATDPGRWVQWLAAGEDRPGSHGRRFLLQVCYLGESFSRYRRAYVESGFRVVDCPTSAGKNSADIHLVIDALDALVADTRYDEFVIASADADFAPLLHRLRAHDRRTTVLRGGPAAPAYTALCDSDVTSAGLTRVLNDGGQVVPADPGAGSPSLPVQRHPAPAAAVAAACKAVLRTVHTADGPVAGTVVAQAARSAHPQLETGPGRFRAFLATHLPELAWSADGRVHDPRCSPAEDVDLKVQDGSAPSG